MSECFGHFIHGHVVYTIKNLTYALNEHTTYSEAFYALFSFYPQISIILLRLSFDCFRLAVNRTKLAFIWIKEIQKMFTLP